MDWFRSHHGAPTDPKWVTIAKRSETQPVVSCALWWALMDYASQHEDRGSIAGFDTETIAVFFGVEEDAILRILTAMREKGLITDDRLTSWEKRQPVREDNSTERVRAFRQRKGTEGNAAKRGETQRNARGDKNREEKKEQNNISRRSGAADTDDLAFQAAWKLYPARASGNPRKAALKAWHARIAQGVDPGELRLATEHYGAYIRAAGKEHTEYVLQGATFYGPNERWREFLEPVKPPSASANGHAPPKQWAIAMPEIPA